MNFDCGIYAIVSPSGRRYIGQAQSFKVRWGNHLQRLRKGNHHCIALQRAWNKYGESSFVFARIAFVPESDLTAREQEQIDSHVKSGNRHLLYNSALCAEFPMRGLHLSEQARRKLSEVRIGKYAGDRHPMFGKKHTADSKERMGAPKRGKQHTEDHRRKISASITGPLNPNYGKALSDARREALADMWRGDKSPLFGVKGSNHPRSKPVLCVTNGLTFANGLEAVQWLRENGFAQADNSTISKACCGKLKTAYGLQWQRPSESKLAA